MNTTEGKTRRTFSVNLFIDDMGSYATSAHSWEDLLWHVNRARDHDGLPHIDIEQLKNARPNITEIH